MHWVKATVHVTTRGTSVLVVGVLCEGAVGPAPETHVSRLC